MGRRSRQRHASKTAAAPAAKPAAPTTRMARVQATDEVWTDFRALAGRRPISELLGQLVAREVDHYRSRRLKQNELEPRELLDALDRARAQQDDLAAIVERLEHLHAGRHRPLPNPADPPAWDTQP